MLPNELNYTTSKLQMVEVFPWLKNIIPKCDCGNQSHFIVKFKYNNSCDDCKTHNCVSDNIFLCNLKCKQLYYDIEYGDCIIEPLDINNYKIKAELLCEKDDCFNCGKRIIYSVIAEGYQILKLPIKSKNKISKKVELFIKNHLILDENSKIEMSRIIYLYKKFYNIDNLSNKQNKEFNKNI